MTKPCEECGNGQAVIEARYLESLEPVDDHPQLGRDRLCSFCVGENARKILQTFPNISIVLTWVGPRG